MSALGQKRTLQQVRDMSALPPESGHQITDAKSEHSQLFDDTIAVAPALLMRT
jgi:hypothetical protein